LFVFLSLGTRERTPNPPENTSTSNPSTTPVKTQKPDKTDPSEEQLKPSVKRQKLN